LNYRTRFAQTAFLFVFLLMCTYLFSLYKYKLEEKKLQTINNNISYSEGEAPQELSDNISENLIQYKTGQASSSEVKVAEAEDAASKSSILGIKSSSRGGQAITKKTTEKPVQGSVAMDWWSEARYVFPIGAVAKVTEVNSGRSFMIKRTFGTNHADCEALTINDTNIIKSIWGGWSWDRKSVVIEVNGKRIAASIAAMPHAGLDNYPSGATVSNRSGGYGTGDNLDEVKGNGMDGVIDVHFKNSKTHGTDKVDPQHQAAIAQAVGK